MKSIDLLKRRLTLDACCVNQRSRTGCCYNALRFSSRLAYAAKPLRQASAIKSAHTVRLDKQARLLS